MAMNWPQGYPRDQYEYEMMKRHEYEMRKMQAMGYQQGDFSPEPTTPPKVKEKPKHLNQKLLLTKGTK